MKARILNPIMLTVIGIIIFACSKGPEKVISDERVKIKVFTVSSEKMIFPVHATGILVPSKEIRLSFKTGGIIKSILANEGSHVKKGELLAILEMPEIDAQVSQAESAYDKALRDYNRARNLYNDSVATLEQLQNAETALNFAKAMREAALFNRNHSRIPAPDDGVILKRVAQEHETIAPGYPVFVFGTSSKQWKVKAGIADKDFVRISAGDSALIAFDVWPGRKFKATVVQLAEAANPMTGTYEIELELAPVKERMAAGFIAGVEIFPSQNEPYLLIPVDAITEANEMKGFVYIVTDSFTVQKTPVNIGQFYREWAAIDSGIRAGDKISTEGSAYLDHGSKVEIVK